jgi:hypothetical protein
MSNDDASRKKKEGDEIDQRSNACSDSMFFSTVICFYY